jgi:predicted molibdopterin-dependent oxidoreductase YjgC
MSDAVTIVVDGRAIEAEAGRSLAAALGNAGVLALRSSVTGEKRGAVCGMGICQECRVTVDGVRHRRACMEIVAAGMRVETGRA